MSPQTNAASMSGGLDFVSRLHATCFPVERLGWRTRRIMACALRDAMIGQLGTSTATARVFAGSVFHIDPDAGLGRSEILEGMRANGIKVPPKRLYGLLRKARRSGLDEIEVGITTDSRFVPLDQGVPIRARLIVRRAEHAVTFRLFMEK